MAPPADHLRDERARTRDELLASPLDERSVAADPVEQFRVWFDDAVAAEVNQPEAMVLASADAGGRPTARVVLLRGLDDRGFAFYTNLESAKAHDLAENPRATVVFHWRELSRQVRVSGSVMAVPRDEAARYYASRPPGSQIGAWASPQSQVLRDRAELERLVDVAEARFAGASPSLPPFWGGFIVSIESLELWQARESRLHDRVRYRRADGGWVVERLAP